MKHIFLWTYLKKQRYDATRFQGDEDVTVILCDDEAIAKSYATMTELTSNHKRIEILRVDSSAVYSFIYFIYNIPVTTL